MPLTANGISYAWQQLIARAGLIDPNAVTLNYGDPAKAPDNRPVITIIPCAPDAASALLKRPAHSVDWIPNSETHLPYTQLPFQDPIPVPFWGKGCDTTQHPFAVRTSSQHIIFYADIIAATLFMLTRWEETVTPERDEHDRFPATASVAYKQGFLDRPIVDEYALILRAWLRVLLPSWQPQCGKFSIKVSHDIDHARRFRNLTNALRTCAHYLKHRLWQKAWNSLIQAMTETIAPKSATYYQNIYTLARLAQTHQIDTTFYFMAASPGPMDNEYQITASHIQTCIQQLIEWQFNIGLHPSYQTFNDPIKLQQEKNRLDKTLPQPTTHARQHYLRFDTPAIWQIYSATGLAHSSNMGYHDQEGFRCGTCHSFTPFDWQEDRCLPLTEQPLIIMDKTLKNYRRLAAEQSLELIQQYALRCQHMEGCFSLLWHNGHHDLNWLPQGLIYTQTLKYLSSLQTGSIP